jgi:hypothetical protein
MFRLPAQPFSQEPETYNHGTSRDAPYHEPCINRDPEIAAEDILRLILDTRNTNLRHKLLAENNTE